MKPGKLILATLLLVVLFIPSTLVTVPGVLRPVISDVDDVTDRSPVRNNGLSDNGGGWENTAFGNISLMVKGNFTGDGASDFIVVNGTDPGMIPVLFDEWQVPTGNRIYCVDGSNGTVIWSAVVNNTVTDLDVADIDGDGLDEIVVSVLRWEPTDAMDHNKLDNGGQHFALDGTGSVMWNHTSGQNGAYMSVLGDFNGDGHLDIATVWTWTMFQYNLSVYTAYNGTYWGGYLGTQYESRTYYDNGTLYTGGSYGYMRVPIQGVAADWNADGTDTLVLQMNSDVYNDTAGHTLLESSTTLLYHYEGNPTAIELSTTFGLATQPYGYDFTAPPMVAGDFITESGSQDLIAISVPISETHRTVRVVSDAGAMLASIDLVRTYTIWLEAADINGDGIDDLVMTDLFFESYDGFPSPAVVTALDGRDLSVIFEQLPGRNGFQGIAALHLDVGDIDTATAGLEIVVSGMNSLVIFSATGDLLYYEAFDGVGLFSFFSDVDEDGKLEVVRALSTWSMWVSGYTSVVSTITEFVMMIPGSLTADEWFVYQNEDAAVSAQFIAPFEDTSGVNITLWNATVLPGQGFYYLDLYSPMIDTRLVDLTAGVPYLFRYEWNTSSESWNQMAFTVYNSTYVDMTVAVFAMPYPRPVMTYTDYQDLINKGLHWLLNEQDAGGYWSASTEYNGEQWNAPSVASTAMAVISLINNGTVSSNVVDAVNWILSQRNLATGSIFHQSQNQTDVVETTWAILALEAYNGTLSTFNTTINDAITAAEAWLISAQYQIGYIYYEEGQPQLVTENSLVYGGWSPRANYTDEPVDLQVTSMALFALFFGDASVSSEPFERARMFISRAQNDLQTNPFGLKTNDGGFLGIPSRQIGSVGSATGAGAFAMALSGAAQTNPNGFRAALNWINNNFIVDEHVGVENYLGGLYFTRMLFISDYWFYLNLGMVVGGPQFSGAQFAALDQAIADFAQPGAGDTASWGSFFGGDSWRATAMSIMTLQTRHGPSLGELRVEMHSNAYLTLIAPDGSTIGYNHTTGLDMTPLGSTYSGAGTDPQVIEVPNPQKGHWTIVVDGNSTGTFDIHVMTYSSGGDLVINTTITEFGVNETTSWEFDLNVIRTVDTFGLVQDLEYFEHDYSIDITMNVVEYPDPSMLVRLEVTATSTDPSIGAIEGPEALEHVWYLYDVTDPLTPVALGTLTWNGIDSRWETTFDSGYLVNGDYFFSVGLRSLHSGATMRNQTPSFTIEHQLSYSLPTVIYDQATQTFASDSFAVDSSYAPHGTVDDTEATVHDWYLYDAASGGSLIDSGTLAYSSGLFSISNTTVADILEGGCYLRIHIVTSQASRWVNGSTVAFILEHTLNLSGATWGSAASQVTLSGLIATSSYGPIGTVDNIEATNSSYYIFTSTGVFTGLSGALSYSSGSGTWDVTVDVSSLAAGDYYIYAVISDGINDVSTQDFDFTVEEATTTTTTTSTTTTTATTTPTTSTGGLDSTTMILVVGGLGGAVVVIIILMALRKKQA